MFSKRVVLSAFSALLMISPIINSNVLANEKSSAVESTQRNFLKESIEINGGIATFERTIDENGVVRGSVIENDKKTTISYDPKSNTLLVNGVKHEINKRKINNKKITLSAVPSGGTYMGEYEYDLNIYNLTASAAAAALSAVTRAPYNAALAAVSVFIGATSTMYYTVYQYRYPMKCQAYPYFDQTKVWTNSSRSKVSSTIESGKYFSTRPTPSSCTP